VLTATVASPATWTPPRSVQDACVQALRTWARDGVPDRPGAWLATVARRGALNAMKRRRTLRAKLPLLVEPGGAEAPSPAATRSPTTGCA
jgi:RNA polymerase sigma-70 factor, ECF subfamily